jgi:acetyltransferase-like isoleucine patch superfamily enzyme
MPNTANVILGQGVQIFHPDLLNLYGSSIGDEPKIEGFVEVQKNALIGKGCRISSHTFLREGITIEDDVFVGHGVMFINDLYPDLYPRDDLDQGENSWHGVRK